MILPVVRDPRLATIRLGETLTEERHHLLAVRAADCAVDRARRPGRVPPVLPELILEARRNRNDLRWNVFPD